MEPISHYYYSHRLKLQFWDWGTERKQYLILVHGGLDHARNWDWVARSLREHFHVDALDLRGHGNSAWAPGALYSVAEHVLDLSALLDVIDDLLEAARRLFTGGFPGRHVARDDDPVTDAHCAGELGLFLEARERRDALAAVLRISHAWSSSCRSPPVSA